MLGQILSRVFSSQGMSMKSSSQSHDFMPIMRYVFLNIVNKSAFACCIRRANLDGRGIGLATANHLVPGLALFAGALLAPVG